MDDRGQIHHIKNALHRLELEKERGHLVEIPAKELPSVQAMSVPERVAWYGSRVDKSKAKAARKRERQARKRGRRERR
jgi:hypothetical protein